MPYPAYPCKQLKAPGHAAKLSCARWMHRVSREAYGGQPNTEFWMGMSKQVGKSIPWLSQLYNSIEELEQTQAEQRFGLGYGRPHYSMVSMATAPTVSDAHWVSVSLVLVSVDPCCPFGMGLRCGSRMSAPTGYSWGAKTSSPSTTSALSCTWAE